MKVSTHLEHLASDGTALADAAEVAGWDARVAACDWDVGELVRHVGGIHRWAAEIVRTAAASHDVPAAREVGNGPTDDALLAWFSAGHAALLETLRAAPEDLECFTFLPAPSALAFWARRQAHETAIHRADAESATGSITPFASAFAQDGIAEMLHGFAARRSMAVAVAGDLVLRPADGSPAWRVQLGGERIMASPCPDGATGGDEPGTAVSGTSSDLYLWLWNRPAEVTIQGDGAVARAWADVRVRWT
jgi:uncharacterized protein (TIGR03083 family)